MSMTEPATRSRGRPPVPLATRLAHKTTALDPTDFDDPTCWFPAVRGIRSFNRMTTPVRALFECKIGRKLDDPQLERLDRLCISIRIMDGEITTCCNPNHRVLVSYGVDSTQASPLPEQPAPTIPDSSPEEDLADCLDMLDGKGPARALNYEECFAWLTQAYSETIAAQALEQYGVTH